MKNQFTHVCFLLFIGILTVSCSSPCKLVLYNVSQQPIYFTHQKESKFNLVYEDSVRFIESFVLDTITVPPCQGMIIAKGWTRFAYTYLKPLYKGIHVYQNDSLNLSFHPAIKGIDYYREEFNRLHVTNSLYIANECEIPFLIDGKKQKWKDLPVNSYILIK